MASSKEFLDKKKLDKTWRKKLSSELESAYFLELSEFLNNEVKAKKKIYPENAQIFSAFNNTPFEDVKVIIIGQDPYHGPDQAHGMCFSVLPGIKVPPSLRNIYKELESDLGVETPTHGHLTSWAKQGVLLLNAVLTVEDSKAGSHHGKGWEKFTDRVIEVLNQEREDLVFLLWGSPAQKKASKVDPKRHYILKCPHPSPLAAYRGFFGSKHFSKTNTFLESKGITPIDWSIS